MGQILSDLVFLLVPATRRKLVDILKSKKNWETEIEAKMEGIGPCDTQTNNNTELFSVYFLVRHFVSFGVFGNYLYISEFILENNEQG